MRIYSLLIIVMCLLSQACSQVPTQTGLITFVLEDNPQEKELLLTDVAEISYFQPSNENPDYLFRRPLIKKGQDEVLFFDYASGSFLFFDKSGKPLRQFNHKGNGPGEYTALTGILFDEGRGEIFAYFKNRIFVYATSDGTYKRSLSIPEESWITEAIDFDENNLLIYDSEARYKKDLSSIADPQAKDIPEQSSGKDRHIQPFVLISKENGSVVKYLNLPKNEDIQLSVTENIAGNNIVFIAKTNHIVPTLDGAFLYNQETDTLFHLSKDLHLAPQAVRSPSTGMTQPIVYLNGYIETQGYQFLESTPLIVERGQFKPAFLMRDSQDGIIYKQKIRFPDYEDKEFTLSPNILINGKTACIELAMDELLFAYKENRLKGELARVVSESNEGSNPVYMFLRFK